MGHRLVSKAEGWETRLNELLRQYAEAGLEYGRHDCLLFALRGLDAQAYTKVAEDWEGCYSSLTDGVALLQQRGFPTVWQYLDSMMERTDRPMRGSLVSLNVDDIHHYGVVDLGGSVAIAGGQGLVLANPSDYASSVVFWKV